jgi:diguanylate cyclase (GGDEF)-like protein/PAS domain S-box-containing protein
LTLSDDRALYASRTLSALLVLFLQIHSRRRPTVARGEPRVSRAHIPPLFRILVVDDEAADRAAFEWFVKKASLPYEYRLASSVAEAKRELECRSFDVILTDYTLRDGTGIEVLAQAGDAAGILVTGNGDETIAVRGMKAGAADYLVKDVEQRYLQLLPAAIEAAASKRRRESEVKMLSRALMSIGEAVYVTDSQDRITFVNRAFCQTYGYAEADVVGRDSEVLWSDRPTIDRAEPGDLGEWTAEVVQRTASGESIIISLSRSIVRDEAGQAVAVVRTARDMTDRYRAEAALKLACEDLERSRAALQEIAARDDLTGLYNRREVNRILANEIARCRRHGHSMAFLLIDLDHFKQINDTYGHAVGDEVLRNAAELLQGTVRSEDLAGRYGGEEFVLVLPETSPEGALHTAERLRQNMAETTILATRSGGTTVGVTVTASIGLAIYPNDASSEVELIEAADRALYHAKNNGRNQTVTFSDYVQDLSGVQRTSSGYEVRATAFGDAEAASNAPASAERQRASGDSRVASS